MGKGENVKITGNQFNTNNFMQNNKKTQDLSLGIVKLSCQDRIYLQQV